MKLKNKKTGGLANIDELCVHTDAGFHDYSSLAELNSEWEDYEEPKTHWSITQFGDVVDEVDGYMSETIDEMKQIGNYFGTREEAEKAVERLRAWKRLKDKEFRFDGIEVFSEGLLEIDGVLSALKKADNADRLKIIDDLELLFGGEE